MEENIILLGTKDINRADWSKNYGETKYYISDFYKDIYKEIFNKWNKSNRKPIYGIGYYVQDYKHMEFYFIKVINVKPSEGNLEIKYESISSSNKRSELLYGFENIGDRKIIGTSTKEKLEYWLKKNGISVNLEDYWGKNKAIVDKSEVVIAPRHDELALEQTANKKTLGDKKKKYS